MLVVGLGQPLMKTRLQLTAKQARCREGVESDSTIKALREMTPAEVDAWIDANVTDLPSAIALQKRIARALLYLFACVDEIDECEARFKVDPVNHMEPPP